MFKKGQTNGRTTQRQRNTAYVKTWRAKQKNLREAAAEATPMDISGGGPSGGGGLPDAEAAAARMALSGKSRHSPLSASREMTSASVPLDSFIGCPTRRRPSLLP
jgi:hypothetical protein